jgi:hypothetical protein
MPAPISCLVPVIGPAGVPREGRRVTGTLKDRLREELLEQARTGLPVTNKELADRLELPPASSETGAPRRRPGIAGALGRAIARRT